MNTLKNLKKNLKTYFKSNYSIVLTNGTAALHLAIKSLNLKKIKNNHISNHLYFNSKFNNNEQSYSDFVDVCENNYTLDPNKLEHKIKK